LTLPSPLFLSGITLYFIVRALEGKFDISQVALSVDDPRDHSSYGTLFFSAVLNVHTGLEELFIKESDISPMSRVPGQPSIPTMLNFILIASAGILTMMNPDNLRSKLKIIGIMIGLIGAFAVFGYIINVPKLYYYIEGVNALSPFIRLFCL